LVEHIAPERVILLPALLWMRRLCPVRFPLDLMVRWSEEIEARYKRGDPIGRETFGRGEVLHG
jgi:hypothetical protein